MQVSDVLEALHRWAPPSLAEGYDNVGLLVGEASTHVQGLLVNLELTPEVAQEALDTGCNVVLCHHPIWFGTKTRLDGTDWVSRLLLWCIRHNLVLLAAHTNLDSVHNGVNARMAEALGLKDLSMLSAKSAPEGHSGAVGMGMLGNLPQALPKPDFLDLLKQRFGSPCIRYADAALNHVQRVAICGGAGSFLIRKALTAGAHALVTGDVTHHSFFDAEGRMLLCDVGHWESEQYTTDLLVRELSAIFTTFAVRRSAVITNPVKYHF